MGSEGRVAIVTGAAQGIGRVYAESLAKDGAKVVCADLNTDGANETVGLIEKAGGTAVALEVDVSDISSARRLADQVKSEFGGADVLVNNAAIYAGMKMDPQMDVDIEYWRKFMSVNLDGALIMTQAIAPLMIDKGWGRIVNQTSIAAYTGYGGAYSVSKLGTIAITQGFARELGPHGITVNAIAPGIIFTEATLGVVPKENQEGIVAMTPIQKKAQPDDLVAALLFFVSEGASWTTGQTLIVDGGFQSRI